MLRRKSKLENRDLVILGFLLLALYSAAVFYINKLPLMGDESIHYFQIRQFMVGNYELHHALTTIPGYNLILAGMGGICNVFSVFCMRLFSSLFGLAAIGVFLLILKGMRQESGDKMILRTLQLMFLPLIGPFFFLLYTDVLSLLFILLTAFFIIKKQHTFAGLMAILAVLIRQNNIVWLIFFLALAYEARFKWKINRSNIIKGVGEFWVFLLGIIGFFFFIILNQGFAVGDKSAHPPFSFHTENLFFALFVYFWVFLPLVYCRRHKIIQLFHDWKTVSIITIAAAAYFLLFHVTHPYNVFLTEDYMRNRILALFGINLWIKGLLFIPIGLGLLTLMSQKIKNQVPFYIFSALFLLPSWLIEQRYYIIPFVLFLTYRAMEKESYEQTLVIWFMMLVAIIFWIVGGLGIFL